MPSLVYSVEIMTSAFSVSTTNVSINTPTIATTPCSWGQETFACAWAWGVEPMPASLENRPRFAPWETAAFIPAPKVPPRMA